MLLSAATVKALSEAERKGLSLGEPRRAVVKGKDEELSVYPVGGRASEDEERR